MPPKIKQELITNIIPQRKKRDRFNGRTEEEVLGMTLPDHLQLDLDIIIIGINPGLTAAHVGHHYAGPGNHFWKCLYLSGLIPEPLNAYDDARLLQFGIGFTNIVERTSRGSADLTKKEIQIGAQILQEKIAKYKPKIAVFNGKGIYEVFCGHKKFIIGKQPDPFPGTNTVIYVMPSSSARCSQLPRAVDKVPFYAALKKLRDFLNGRITEASDSDFIFPDLDLKVELKREVVDVKLELDAGGEAEKVGAVKRRRSKSTTFSFNIGNGDNVFSTETFNFTNLKTSPVKRNSKKKTDDITNRNEKIYNEDATENNGGIISTSIASLLPSTTFPQSNGSTVDEPHFMSPSPQIHHHHQNHWMYEPEEPFHLMSGVRIKEEVDRDDYHNYRDDDGILLEHPSEQQVVNCVISVKQTEHHDPQPDGKLLAFESRQSSAVNLSAYKFVGKKNASRFILDDQ